MNLTCCRCGERARAKKHWHNRSTGFGLCGRCAKVIQARRDYNPAEFRSLYGDEGVHWLPETA